MRLTTDKRLELRRTDDVENQVTREEFDRLLSEVRQNTRLTQEIHDLISGLKIMAHIAKWVTVIAAAFAAVMVAVKQGAGMKL